MKVRFRSAPKVDHGEPMRRLAQVFINVDTSKFVTAMEEATRHVSRFARRHEDRCHICEIRRREQELFATYLAANAAAVYADLGLIPPTDSVVRTEARPNDRAYHGSIHPWRIRVGSDERKR